MPVEIRNPEQLYVLNIELIPSSRGAVACTDAYETNTRGKPDMGYVVSLCRLKPTRLACSAPNHSRVARSMPYQVGIRISSTSLGLTVGA